MSWFSVSLQAAKPILPHFLFHSESMSLSLSLPVCLTLLTAPEHLNPVWKQLAPSDLINRRPGQWARGNISAPLLSYNQFRTIDSVIETQNAPERTGALVFGCAKALYISLYDLFLCVCVCVHISSSVCIWIAWFIIWAICSKVGMAFNLAPLRWSQKKNHF